MLTAAIREEIAEKSVKFIAPLIFTALFLAILLNLFFAPDQFHRALPEIVGIALILPAWIMAFKGRAMLAINLCILIATIPILAGMAMSGGIHAPVFVGIISVPCFIVFLYGISPAIFLAVFLMAAGMMFTQLVSMGLLPRPETPPSDVYLLFNHGIWIFVTLIFFSIPMKMLAKALFEKEKQLQALQTAMAEKTRSKEKLKQLATVVEQASDEIMITDLSGTIIYVNPSIVAATGYSSDELVGENPRILKSKKHDAAFYKTLWDTISTGRTWKGRIWNRTKDNQLVLHDAVVTPIFDIHDQINAYVSVRRDITELIRMQDRMVQSEKMMAVGGLAAGMAHEINNPLGIILQTTQNIVRRLKPDFPKNRTEAGKIGLDLELTAEYLSIRSIDTYLESIRLAGERAAKIVKGMLEFSRISDAEKRHCDINKIIDRVLEMTASDYDLKTKYDFKKINIIRNYADGCGIRCLESEIGQVLLNILKNATQAMADDQGNSNSPLIEITTSQQEKTVRIEIKDNGPGMDARTKKEIFQPFYTTKSPGKGTGLGLSISYFIITFHHNGTLRVESEKRAGSCFIIELPKE